MVSATRPSFVLVPQAADGNWQFTLKAADDSQVLRVGDQEPDMVGERLELLSVVRGLEALDQPSRVTVMLSSKYVARGLAYGLDEWRREGWVWERFGDWVEVKNSDLWQRLDRAMTVHDVEFCRLRVDSAESLAGPNRPAAQAPTRPVRLSRGTAPCDGRRAPRPPREGWPDQPAMRPAGPRRAEDAPVDLLAPLRRAMEKVLQGLAPARS